MKEFNCSEDRSMSQYFVPYNKSVDNNFRNQTAHSRRHDDSNRRFIQSSHSYRQKNKKQNHVQRPYTAVSTRKTPRKVGSQNFKDGIINDFNNMGLQSFMKQLITKQAPTNQEISNRIIFALNRTYLSNNITPPNNQLPVKFAPKTNSTRKKIFRESIPQVLPQDYQVANQSSSSGYIINQMFPYRKDRTKILKAKHYGAYNAQRIEQETHMSQSLKKNAEKNFEQQLKKTASKLLSSSKSIEKNYRAKNKNLRHNRSVNLKESGVSTSKAVIHY